MDYMNFTQKSTYKITPNQAHKILEKLKAEVKELKEYEWERESFVDFTISKIDVNLDTKKIEEKLTNIFLQRIKNKKLLAEIQEDILNIKEVLFNFNVTLKVSKKLSQIEILKNHIKFYQNFKECLECEEIDGIERAKEYLRNAEDEKVNLKLAFYDYEEVKKKLKEANKKIMELEKEITYLNSSNEIEITIYKNTAELIGLG